MVNRELSDSQVGILVELYWNGQKKSRDSALFLRSDIEYLIDAGLIKEFRNDMIWWGMIWMVRIKEQGVDTLKLEIDPLLVFNLFLTTVRTIKGACAWVMMFDLAQLPAAFVHSNSQIRAAAETRLMEIENKIDGDRKQD